MALDFYGIEKGLRIFEANSDNNIVILTGAGTPDTSADFTAAEIGSLYIRRGTGELYQKSANTGAASDWEISGGSQIGTWRPEKIRVVSGDTITPGTPRDLTANPFSDDEGSQLSAADFTVGEFAIISNVIYEVTAVSSPNVTFSSVGAELALSESDTFVAINYLPDSPDSQEGQAIVTYNGSAMVKIADIDWNFSDGISMAAGYSSSAGTAAAISSSDSVQTAIQKAESQNKAQDSVLGTALGDIDLGTFAGATISDNTTVKGALGELESSSEEIDQNVDDLITLSGMPENSVNLGTFPGGVISDNTTVKNALSELEAKDESQDGIITEIDANVDDLITLSGVAENSTNLGTFTGFGAILFTATETVKSALQKVTNFLGNLRSVKVTGVTTAASVDEVPVASIAACQWDVVVFEEATPANRQAFIIYGLNDGTNADYTQFAKLKLGSNFNISLDVDVSGGNMRLRASSSTAGVTVRARRIAVEDV